MRIILLENACPFPDKRNISVVMISPAATAKKEAAAPLIPRIKMQKTAAAEDPAVTPIISGEARGFLNRF